MLAFSTVVAIAATVPAALAATATQAAAVGIDALAPSVSRTYCGNDIWAVSVTPARGFNPLTATAAQLESNGYPAKPSSANARGLAQWRSFATSHPSEKTSCDLRRTTTAATSMNHSDPETTTANWAGYVVYGGAFTEIEGEWTYTPAPATATSMHSVSWVGLGPGDLCPAGVPCYPLVQAGSDSSTGADGSDLWFEVVPFSAKLDLELSNGQIFVPQDLDIIAVHIAVYNDTVETGCSNQACTATATCTAEACGLIHVSDLTQDFNESYEVGGDWQNGGQAEWIYERPCIGPAGSSTCELQSLADAPPTFSDAEALVDGGSWQSIGTLYSTASPYAVQPVEMVDCSSADSTPDLAAPVIPPSGSTITINFMHHGLVDTC